MPILRSALAYVAIVGLVPLMGCSKKREEELSRMLTEANDKVVACKRENNDLKNEVAALKRQLAEAMANPSRLTLTDPEVINLIASIRQEKGITGDVKPTLDPKEASRVVMNGAPALRTCYERALKKNTALQGKAGLGVTLEITVRNAGSVDAVEVAPSVDKEMTACIKQTALKWKFPTFQGEPVTLSQKLTLTPKT
jgi:hypothetical protein